MVAKRDMWFAKKRFLLGIALSFYGLNMPTPAFSEDTLKPAGEAAITSSLENPCYAEEKVHKITVQEISEKVKDFDKGDPLFYSLLAIFLHAKKETCYYVDGKDLQKIFLHKGLTDLSELEIKAGKTFYKTRWPVDEIRWASAKISGGDIKFSSRLSMPLMKSILGKKVLEIPQTLDFTIYTSRTQRKDEYLISISYESSEEPFMSDIFTLLTGLTTHEMHVEKYDKKPNRRETYKTFHYLHENGMLNIYQ